MYAIVEISGKQFKVAKSDKLKVPMQNAAPEDKLQFTNVMLVDNEGKVEVGTPFVKNAEVSAHVIEHGRDKKIIVFKKKRRKDYKVKRGHRQGYTLIQIDDVSLSKAKEKKPEPATETKKATPAVKKAAPAVKKISTKDAAAPKKAPAAKKTEKE